MSINIKSVNGKTEGKIGFGIRILRLRGEEETALDN